MADCWTNGLKIASKEVGHNNQFSDPSTPPSWLYRESTFQGTQLTETGATAGDGNCVFEIHHINLPPQLASGRRCGDWILGMVK